MPPISRSRRAVRRRTTTEDRLAESIRELFAALGEAPKDPAQEIEAVSRLSKDKKVKRKDLAVLCQALIRRDGREWNKLLEQRITLYQKIAAINVEIEEVEYRTDYLLNPREPQEEDRT